MSPSIGELIPVLTSIHRKSIFSTKDNFTSTITQSFSDTEARIFKMKLTSLLLLAPFLSALAAPVSCECADDFTNIL